MTEPGTVKAKRGRATMPRKPLPPLTPEWVLVDGLPVIHRYCLDAGTEADAWCTSADFGSLAPTWSPPQRFSHRTLA